MRLFIASSFEPQFIETLQDIAAYARANAGSDTVKWVERCNFHLTYIFLGELGGSGVTQAIKSVDCALEGYRAFKLSLGVLGAFIVIGQLCVRRDRTSCTFLTQKRSWLRD